MSAMDKQSRMSDRRARMMDRALAVRPRAPVRRGYLGERFAPMCIPFCLRESLHRFATLRQKNSSAAMTPHNLE